MIDKVLVDSHLLIWLIFENENLNRNVLKYLDSADQAYVSTASIWELALKHKKGKLLYNPEDIMKGCSEMGLSRLNILDKHINAMKNIKLPHKDPFDELLVAQADSESMTLLTADRLLIESEYKTFDAR